MTMCRSQFKLIFIVLILIFSSTIFVGCNCSTDLFIPKIEVVSKYQQYYVNQVVNINTLFVTNLNTEYITYSSSNSDVVKIDGDMAKCVASGSSTLSMEYTYNDTCISDNVDINVIDKVVYATSINCPDSIAMKLGDTVKIADIVSFSPNYITVEASYTVVENDIIDLQDGLIVAHGLGSAKIVVSIRSDVNKFITKIINVNVVDKVTVDAEYVIKDASDNVVDYLITGCKYKIYLDKTINYEPTKFDFGDGVEMINISLSDKVIIEVTVISISNLTITYCDEDYLLEIDLSTSYSIKDIDKYLLNITGDNGEDIYRDETIYFTLGADGVDNPFVKYANITLTYDGNDVIGEFDILCNNSIARIEDNKLFPLSIGNATINISNGSINYTVNVVIDYSYVEDFVIKYDDIIYVCDVDYVIINVVKDAEYNVYREYPLITLHDNHKFAVDGMKITIIDYSVKAITGTVKAGNIVKDFAITVVHDRIDSVVLSIYGEVLHDNIYTMNNAIAYIDVYAYYMGNKVELSSGMTALVDGDSVYLDSDTITNRLIIYHRTSGTSIITLYDDLGTELYKLTVVA